MKLRNKIIFLLFLFIIELILKSSGIGIISNIELLIIGIVLIEEVQGRDLTIFIIFLTLSMVLEAINFELVAMRGFITALVYLLTNNIFNSFKVLSGNRDLKMLSIVLFSIVIVSIFRSYELLGRVELNIFDLVVNLLVYIIIYRIISKLAPNRYVI
jgi:hypothetical protein